mmetsp:Transcript_44690/g.129264  ORF Transcript_44690/g.129264 Transcript_44690/m.129264 type:complete len:95 (+) Transcript_44690:1027-1311(+)
MHGALRKQDHQWRARFLQRSSDQFFNAGATLMRCDQMPMQQHHIGIEQMVRYTASPYAIKPVLYHGWRASRSVQDDVGSITSHSPERVYEMPCH